MSNEEISEKAFHNMAPLLFDKEISILMPASDTKTLNTYANSRLGIMCRSIIELCFFCGTRQNTKNYWRLYPGPISFE